MALAKLNKYGVFSNGVGATVLLTEPQLQAMSDGAMASGVTVPDGDTAIVLASFANRYVLSEVRVWHDAGTVSVSASMDGASWDSLSSTTYAGYTSVSGSLSGFDNWPRYVAVTHAALGVPATLHEIEIQGYSGQVEEALPMVDVDISSDHEFSEVILYNTSADTRSVYCCIDADAIAGGSATYALATSSGGPFYSLRDTGHALPRDYSWSSGEFVNTTISGSYIILLGTETSGTYTSPVVDTYYNGPLLAYWDHYDETGTAIDFSAETSDRATIRVRTSNHSPSGGWSSGQSPDAGDFLWGSTSGSLPFGSISQNDLLTISVGQYRYAQLSVQFSAPVSGTSSRLSALGLEEAQSLGTAAPGTSVSAFVRTTTSGYTKGQSSALTTFFFG